MGSLTLNSLKQLMRAMVDNPGFDRVLSKVNLKPKCPNWALNVCFQTVDVCCLQVDVVSAIPGKVVCEMRVDEEHTNRGGTMHGGMTATLVDVISTMAIMYSDRGAPGVSVDMNIT